MKRYLKWFKGKDGKLRMYGYTDEDNIKTIYGLAYVKDFQDYVEIVPIETKLKDMDAQELINHAL